MRFRDMIGQSFRDATGMPPKVSSYNSKLKLYDEISGDVDEVRNGTIKYFEEIQNIDWRLIEARRIKLEADVRNGKITPQQYAYMATKLDEEVEMVLDNFISSSDDYFVTAYRNRLYSIKKRHVRDPYIAPMEFDTWFQMKEAKELAELAALQIRCSDEYVDAKKIAEISERYKRERHLRRGR